MPDILSMAGSVKPKGKNDILESRIEFEKIMKEYKYFIDTNVFIRVITADIKKQFQDFYSFWSP